MLLSQFIYIADFVMVDYFLNDLALAYYFVAIMISKIILIVADTIGSIIFALYTQTNSNKKKYIDENMYLVSSSLFCLSIVVFLFFLLFGKFFLSFIYNDSYIHSYNASLLLISGTQGIIIYKFLSRKLASENNWKILYRSVIIGALTNVILNLILIPKFGIEGAAFSSMISYWTCGIAVMIFSKENIFNFLFRINLNKIIGEK